MPKLRIEAVYIDPEVYEPMQELFGLGGMLFDARVTFEIGANSQERKNA